MKDPENYSIHHNGRLSVLRREFYYIGEATMKSCGEKLLKQLPEDWGVEVTAGPYRVADLTYEISLERKIVGLDFYSVRPGLQYLDQAIAEIKDFIEKHTDVPVG